MGRAAHIVWCVVLCSGLLLVPQRGTTARAQTPAVPTCSGTISSSPMQGRYIGPWHSDADYHFAVFNTDLVLTITIDGTLDVTVSPDGRVSGVARGTVDAPIHHDGIHDVSSGTGTISGIVQGVLSPGSSTVILSQPVIAMQWGTFIPGGYTVPRSITMPTYQFPVSGADCISLHGSIAEQNFPTQFVVADGASGLTQAPGIGTASGSWSLTHVESSTFTQLSGQTDTLIASANAALASAGGTLSIAAFNSTVLQPLQALLATIQQNPDIARCLLERIDAWLATAVPALRLRAQALGSSTDLAVLRQAFDLLTFARLMQSSCTLPDDGKLGTVVSSEIGVLDGAIRTHDWGRTALAARESVLTSGDTATIGRRVTSDLHALLQSSLSTRDKLDAARVAYAVGDEVDAREIVPAHALTSSINSRIVTAVVKKHRKRKHAPKPKPTPTRTPKPTPTPTPTATPRPVSLAATLEAGAGTITARSSGGSTPTFSWQAVNGAVSYLVLLSTSSGASLPWAWAGTATSVQYGDTALPGVAGSEAEPWLISLPASARSYSVLALDAAGHIIAVALRLAI